MSITNNAAPIYQQIMELFEYDIASGLLLPGVRLDSIRDLAVKYRVNPNTMARALSELENQGLIYTDRTNGKYVVDDVESLEKSKLRLMKQDAKEYILKAKKISLSQEDTIQLIKDLWEEDYE